MSRFGPQPPPRSAFLISEPTIIKLNMSSAFMQGRGRSLAVGISGDPNGNRDHKAAKALRQFLLKNID